MPYTLNGFGTRLYGARDFLPDNSYVTTKWIVLAYMPIVPLSSMRVRPSEGSIYLGFYNRSRYSILDTAKPNPTQVLCIYGWFVAFLFSISFSAELFSLFNQPALFLLILPVLIAPFYLRSRARKQMRVATERKEGGMSDTTVG